MVGEWELRILDFLSRRLLARSHEIKNGLGRHDGIDGMLSGLFASDYINIIEPMGEKCFVITHKGTKMLEDAKAAGWKAAERAPDGSRPAQTSL